MFVILWKSHSDRGVSRYIEYHKFIFADDVFADIIGFLFAFFQSLLPPKKKSHRKKLPSMTEKQRMKNEEDVLDVLDNSAENGVTVGTKAGQKAKKTAPKWCRANSCDMSLSARMFIWIR